MSDTTSEPMHDATPVAADDEDTPDHRPLYRRPLGLVMLMVMLLAGVGGYAWWQWASQWESTDDAFVEGDVIPVGTRVAGTVQKVCVVDNQRVKAGDVLVQIDPRDFDAKLAQAKASLQAAKADADAAKTNVDLTRVNSDAALAQAQAGVASAEAAVDTAKSQLASAQADVTSAEAQARRRDADQKRYAAVDPRGVSRSQLDAARSAADAARAQVTATKKRVAAAQAQVSEAKAKVAAAQGVLAAARTGPQQVASAQARARFAEARVAQAQAEVDAAKLERSYTVICAPVDGRVARKSVEPGQALVIGQTLLAVIAPDRWVVANFKETQMARMRPGQPVDIYVDALPGRALRGHVDSVQAGTGARFSLLPPENATGNYVKVVQRVPVKIVFDEKPEALGSLGLGESVEPVVRVTGEAAAPAKMMTAAAR